MLSTNFCLIGQKPNSKETDKPPAGSALSNGREPRSCLGRVFNFKLDRFASLHNKCMAHIQPLLKLKTWPRFVLLKFVHASGIQANIRLGLKSFKWKRPYAFVQNDIDISLEWLLTQARRIIAFPQM